MSNLFRRFGLLRAARFGIASVVGFLVAELIIVSGLFALYGSTDVPAATSGWTDLLALDVFALVIGVTVSFAMNERTTFRDASRAESGGNVLARLAMFQLVSAMGNAVVIAVQILLLSAFAITPAFGNVCGAIVAYPVSYLVSTRTVWRT